MMQDEVDRFLEEVDAHYERTTPIDARLPSDLGDPRKYIQALEPLLDEARVLWTSVVWNALALRRRQDLAPPAQAVLEDMFERISRQALWAVTEIRYTTRYKLLSQRYLSMAVYEHWLNLSKRGSATQGEFERLPGDEDKLQHEHVMPIARLQRDLLAAGAIETVQAVLASSVACVVTKRQALKLNSAGDDGWKRYERLGIEVWDRQIQGPRVR